MTFRIVGKLGHFDHRRMVEDLLATSADLIAAGAAPNPSRAPLSLLGQIGGDMLYAAPSDRGGFGVRRDSGLHAALRQIAYRRAFGGALPVTWLHLALVLGRRDLRQKFRGRRGMDVEKAMQWLALYGVDEHRLWRYLDADFIRALRERAVPVPGGLASPLDMILLRERPELGAKAPPGTPEFAAAIDDWIERDGVHEYKLFWALRAPTLAAMSERGAGGERLRGDRALDGQIGAARLGRAHDERRLDLFVESQVGRAAWLERASQLGARERDDERIAYEGDPGGANAEAPAWARADLAGGPPFACIDFEPGGLGRELDVTGALGRPVAGSSPILSRRLTLLRPKRAATPTVFLVDLSVADAATSVLALVDGKPADFFPGEFLAGNVAKIYADWGGERAIPTLELEFAAGGPSPAAPFGHIRNLTIFTAPET